MNEATQASIEALNAVANSLDAPVEPRKFERRNTVSLPIPDSAAERAAHSRVDPGVSHMDAMLEEKNAIHGDFTQDATTAQALKYVMRQGKNWEEMPPWMREALEQMQTKVARILAGDFNHPDHWKDLQGYPRLVETRLETK
jgi:hypothetical protein